MPFQDELDNLDHNADIAGMGEATEVTHIKARKGKPPRKLQDQDACSVSRVCENGGRDYRDLTCLSGRQKYTSSTLRKMGERPRRLDDKLKWSGYLPAVQQTFFNTTGEIATVLSEAIFWKKDDSFEGKAAGLVVITGATNSAKSDICRALIHRYLEARLRQETTKRLHLVTFEDPIEVWFRAPKTKDNARIDYTPREKGKDVRQLTDALEDALRQTPELFYIGETRDRHDWKHILNFAGSGHLVVTTAHAGSLQEAMRNIFESTESRTPAERSAVGARLKAVVHLYREPAGARPLVPALWRQTLRGQMALMQSGLSAVIPQRYGDANTSCLGRAWFLDKLICERHHNDPGDDQIATLKNEMHAKDLIGK